MGKKKDQKQSVLFFTKAVEANPGFFEAYNNRGLAYSKNNHPNFFLKLKI